MSPASPAPVPSPITSVLVANRGEIVVRICRTLAGRAMRSVAVYTPDDAGALHARSADAAIEVERYLDAQGLLAAAKASGADAVHPGYGLLSEDADFARAVTGAGIVWIGPPPEAIETMGDKIRAKETVAAAGVPVVPGAGRTGSDDDELVEAALDLGLPVVVKPAAGGGGKGMHRVADAAMLRPAIATARREAEGAFGAGTLLVERWVPRPRHVEVQVFADAYGSVVHLGDRECSLQRRHQKLVEECPSLLVSDETRSAMAASAVDVSRACGYVGAGTVEFIVPGDRPDEYFFMEMNTRLQVEHPVTEMVTGMDLVDWQLRVAAGEPLPAGQGAVRRSGHAVEARVYAEDPEHGFLPAAGLVALAEEAAGRPLVRVDSSLAAGSIVGTRYDPLLAKVVAWGASRAEALDRLRAALGATTVLGVTTNVGYLTRLLADPEVVAGRIDTELVERTLDELASPPPDASAEAAVAAACCFARALEPAGPVVDPWDVPDAWRVAGMGEWVLELQSGRRKTDVRVRGRLCERHAAAGDRSSRPGRASGPAVVQVDDGTPLAVSARWAEIQAPSPASGGRSAAPAHALWVTVDGTTTRWVSALVGDDVWVGRGGQTWRFSREVVTRSGRSTETAGGGRVTSPMPGVVVAVLVAPGDVVRAGEVLATVEAMKMEHAAAAPSRGVVSSVLVRVGQQVALGEVLVEVGPRGPGGPEDAVEG